MDKKNLFQIGEVARMFHLSVGSLRHYEKAGLLHPEYIDPDSGYRYYSTKQFEVLNMIRSCRVLGMPLEQIAEFLDHRSIDKMYQMLENQKQAVLQQQKELAIVLKKIEHRMNLLEDASSSELDQIAIRSIPQRRVAWLKNQLSLETYTDLEPSICQLNRNQENTAVWLGKVGVGISKDHLLAQKFDAYDRVFLILDPEDTYSGQTEIWPSLTCACLRFCGSHKDAPPYYARLLDFLEQHQFNLSGFSREITLIDDGITNNPDQFVTEIQLPFQT